MNKISWGACAIVMAASWATAADSRAVEIMNFSTNDPAGWEELRNDKSEAKPLTLEEIEKLVKAGVKEKNLVRMIRARKALVSPTGDVLARLKKQGAGDRLIEAVSTYGFPENRSIDLLLTLDISTPYSLENAPALFISLVHEASQTQEDLLMDSLARILSAKWMADETVDDSDPLLPNKVRRIQIRGPLKAVRHGKMSLKVLLSKRADLTDLTDLTALKKDEAESVKTIYFEYPAVSLQNSCRLDLRLGRDPLLSREFSINHQQLRCFWD